MALPAAGGGLDQFYTRQNVAAECIDALLRHLGPRAETVFFVEPSAGAGAFLHQLPPRRWGGDVDPRAPDVVRADFLADALPDFGPRERVVVVGNPPYGRLRALARAFVRRAAEIADTIAFILPAIFRDNGRGQSRPPPRYAQTLLRELPPAAFETRDGAPYIYPAVFLVFERTGRRPPPIPRPMPRTVRYLQWRDRDRANMFVQLYGGYDAGRVFVHEHPPHMHWRTCIPLDADSPGLVAIALLRHFAATLRPPSRRMQWITVRQVLAAIVEAERNGWFIQSRPSEGPTHATLVDK